MKGLCQTGIGLNEFAGLIELLDCTELCIARTHATDYYSEFGMSDSPHRKDRNRNGGQEENRPGTDENRNESLSRKH
jgi:hypothetical protein